MGHDAAVTKRKVLDTVELCVKAANQAVSDSAHVIQTHDAFVKAVGEAFEQRDTRINAQGEWLDQVDGSITALNESVKALDNSAGLAHERVTNLRSEVTHFLRDLTFRERLRWLLFGYVPAKPEIAGFAIDPPTIDRTKPTALLVNEGGASPLVEAFRR